MSSKQKKGSKKTQSHKKGANKSGKESQSIIIELEFDVNTKLYHMIFAGRPQDDAEEGEIVDMSLESAHVDQKITRPSKEESINASAKIVIPNRHSSASNQNAPPGEQVNEINEQGDQIMNSQSVDNEEEEEEEEKQRDQQDNYLQKISIQNIIVVPSKTSDWFSMDEVKQLEKDALPEFFNGKYPSKTQQVYKEYRNFMIQLYRQNPLSYLSATTCRRHLSGDVCSIMRVHAFLEQWGLINFNCQPYLKPHKISVIKESSYNKVLVNAANKHFLQKNEEEYLTNLFDVEQPQSKVSVPIKAQIDQGCIRKINLLTSRERPFCAFCSALCGFTWQKAVNNTYKEGEDQDQEIDIKEQSEVVNKVFESFDLCDACFNKGNYPNSLSVQNFEQKQLPHDSWERIQKDITPEIEQQAKSKPSHLSKEDQSKLMTLVMKCGGDDWKKIAEEMNFKNKKEAILEFLRVPIDQDSKYLVDATFEGKVEDTDLKTVNPYNQADQLFLQCELLQKFANQQPEQKPNKIKIYQNEEERIQSKRLMKEKRKLAQKIMVQELLLMEEELKEMKTVDNTLTKIKHDYKNLMSQMFAERVSLTISNKRLSQ